MSPKFEKLLETIGRTSVGVLMGLMTVFVLLKATAFTVFYNITSTPHPAPNPVLLRSPFEAYMASLVVAPIVETAIFQLILLRVLLVGVVRKFVNLPLILCVILSAVPFALTHNHATVAMFTSFLSGLVFGAVYLGKSRPGGHPFLVVTAIHFTGNLTLLVGMELWKRFN